MKLHAQVTQDKIILCNGLQMNKCKIMNKHRPKSMPITVTSRELGKTTESDCHPNPTTNPNPNPYLVVVRYGGLAGSCKNSRSDRISCLGFSGCRSDYQF